VEKKPTETKELSNFKTFNTQHTVPANNPSSQSNIESIIRANLKSMEEKFHYLLLQQEQVSSHMKNKPATRDLRSNRWSW
jgi:hypothetical protein